MNFLIGDTDVGSLHIRRQRRSCTYSENPRSWVVRNQEKMQNNNKTNNRNVKINRWNMAITLSMFYKKRFIRNLGFFGDLLRNDA